MDFDYTSDDMLEFEMRRFGKYWSNVGMRRLHQAIQLAKDRASGTEAICPIPPATFTGDGDSLYILAYVADKIVQRAMT